MLKAVMKDLVFETWRKIMFWPHGKKGEGGADTTLAGLELSSAEAKWLGEDLIKNTHLW